MAAIFFSQFAPRTLRPISSPTKILLRQPVRRSLHASRRQLADGSPSSTVVMSQKKPIGAFRGSLFGFFFGSTLAGAGTYYYILEEYRVSNEMLTEDIYALQAAVQRVHNYVTSLEEKVEALEKKKK
ncbi:hypothetical protein MMC25_003730 [Agyrium rufum]|nr:hypothetical protein [Agyrium rufum]